MQSAKKDFKSLPFTVWEGLLGQTDIHHALSVIYYRLDNSYILMVVASRIKPDLDDVEQVINSYNCYENFKITDLISNEGLEK